MFYVHENCKFLIFKFCKVIQQLKVWWYWYPIIIFVGNLLLFAAVKEFSKSINNDKVIAKIGCPLFWTTLYVGQLFYVKFDTDRFIGRECAYENLQFCEFRE